jgi:NDP-sugar pyrophosphorylase family protein
MKAMILAAGLGTRLRPLTDDRPKALVEVAGRTMLEISLRRLSKFGIQDVIVNVHHCADMVVDYLKRNGDFGMHIEISREEILLDTGGGLKKAAPFFLQAGDRSQEPFLVHNVDVVSTIDLGQMLRFHRDHSALATLAVQERETSRYLRFDRNGELCGRRAAHDEAAEMVPPSQDLQELAFCGIHIISPRLLNLMEEEGVFSIIPVYLRLAGQGENILAFRADQWYWRDLGKPEHVEQAAREAEQGMVQF